MIDGLTTGKQDIEEPKENEAELATIVEIGKNGLVLQFDGEEETREKNYRCNSGVKFAVGDRVKIHKTSGTYIVEYAVGNPNSRVPVGLPSGGSAGQILTKTSSGAAWNNAPTGLPSGGSAGQVLTKTSYGAAWNNAPTELPNGGSAGQVLTKTSSGAAWNDAPTLPSGGSVGQVLTKTSSGAAWNNAPTELPSGGSAGQVLTKTSSGAAWNNAPTPSKISNSSYTGSYYVEVTNLGEIKMNNNKIGFFGSNPVVKQTLSTSATLSQLIQALKKYGLV